MKRWSLDGCTRPHARRASRSPRGSGRGLRRRSVGCRRRRRRNAGAVSLRDRHEGERGAGLLLRRRSRDRIDVRHLRRRRAETGIRFPQHDRSSSRPRGDELVGAYRNNRAGARAQNVRMRRFTPVANADENTPALAGNWEMRRVADEITAPRDTRTWHVFLRQSGAEVSGTILRVDGDTGTLVGHWQNGKLSLSHFAGERPNAVRSDAQRRRHARRHAQRQRPLPRRAAAPRRAPRASPSRRIRRATPTSRIRRRRFSSRFRTSTARWCRTAMRSVRGKVMLLAIGGSWCPNCHDEAPFLVRAVQGLSRARARDRRPDVRERSGSEGVGQARAVVRQALQRAVSDPVRRHDAAVADDQDDRRGAAAAGELRRLSDDDHARDAMAGCATSTPASRARRPARSTRGTSRKCAS